MNTPVKKSIKKASHVSKDSDAAAQADVKRTAAPAADDVPASSRKEKPAKNKGLTSAAQPLANGAAESKGKRAKKEKVMRDSFTMPMSDYEKIAALKQKCLEAGVSVKKSELLRAGLLVLEAAPVKRLIAVVTALETVKTGRPAKSQ
jgi:hypothetical protein